MRAAQQRRDDARKSRVVARRGNSLSRRGNAAVMVRSSCPVDNDDDRMMHVGLERSTGVLSPAQKQREFEVSGMALSANEKLAEFFWSEIKNGRLGNWKSSRWLEDLSRSANAGSSRMNNRARDLREVDVNKNITSRRFNFTASGYWIDQCSDEKITGVKGSAYCVCLVKNAVSLSNQDKLKISGNLLNNDINKVF